MIPFGGGREARKEFEKWHKEMDSLMRREEDLGEQASGLADKYRDAPTDKKAEIKSELEKIVEQQFDLRQERRAMEVKRLEEDLKRIRTMMDRRKEARKQVVSNRVAELLDEEVPQF
jgi:hypothetical protein